MVYFHGDAYWVSRRLDNVASSHAGALWIVYSCSKGMCSIATNDTGQDDYSTIADTFESCLAQLEDYDELFYLTKFILDFVLQFSLRVFVQRPTTLLEAKRIAEELELTQMMVKRHQNL